MKMSTILEMGNIIIINSSRKGEYMDASSLEDVKKLYEDTADSYNNMMDNEIDLPIYTDTLSRLSERIADLPGLVVDTSCGSGHMLHLYHTRFDQKRSLVAIDLSPRMVRIASEKLGKKAKAIIANMSDLNMVASGSAAGVLNYFALHHIGPGNVLPALREWNRLLYPKGQLVLAAWEGTGTIDYGDEADIVAFRYKKKELVSWVEASGFVVDRCSVEDVEEMPMKAIYLEATKG